MNATMKTGIALAALLAAGCASKQGPTPHGWAHAVQTAETREAHERLAQHYDEIAQMMDADAAEERAMLAQYQASPHKYGKNIQDIKARATAMIRDFEMAGKESRWMAEYHRKLAAERR